ncbi:MAG: ROK family protein [Acidobacteriales bacterium]|nr:ROK family protein [Terriglobales bacterium]
MSSSSSTRPKPNGQAKAPAHSGASILCFDIGGSGMKAMLVSVSGQPLSDRVRVETPQLPTPPRVLDALRELGGKFHDFDYIACGFPGVIKHGTVFTAANLDPAWVGFKLQEHLQQLFNRPVRVANDAAVQGMAAISGKGVELCLTFGTGMGSSLFIDGVLVPGLELGHHPFRKGKTYEDYLGRAGLEKWGKKKWNKRLSEALPVIEHLFNYDRLYIGGGNNKLIRCDLPKNASLVMNLDGLRGGAALWRDVAAAGKTLVRTDAAHSPLKTSSKQK